MTTTRSWMRTGRRVAAILAVLLVAVLVPMAPPAAAGGGGCFLVLGGDGPTQATGTTVELKGACMTPTVLRADPGSEITFVNRDEMTHNLYGAGLAVSALQLGQSATVRYERPGTYPFACTIHPGMVGAVVVGDGRFASDVDDAPGAAMVTTTTAAPVPLAASHPIGRTTPADPAPALVLAVVLALVVGGTGYVYGRQSSRDRLRER